jgi:hypothetical protein
MYSLTPAKWNRRLPYYAKVYNDRSRLKRTDARTAEAVYRSEKDIVGLLVHTAYDDGAAFDVSKDVTFLRSTDGREYAPLKTHCRRIVGCADYAKALYWSYNVPAGTRCLKVRIDGGAPAHCPQIMRLEFNYGSIRTKVVDEMNDFSKMHSHSPNLAFDRLNPEKFALVEGCEYDQRLIDDQIRKAKYAGIDFWANLDPPIGPFTQSALYGLLEASPHKRDIKFCIIICYPKHKVEPWPKRVSRYVSYFKRDNYQKVLDGRPLVLVFDAKKWRESDINRLRAQAEAAGVGKPYVLAQGKGPWADGTFGYVSHTPRKEGILTLNLGRNDVPRHENPPLWGHCGWKGRIPGTKEIVGRLERSVKWCRRHPKINRAKTLLIYAWDENAEGGWIVPTWTPKGPNTERIDAFHKFFYPEPASAPAP